MSTLSKLFFGLTFASLAIFANAINAEESSTTTTSSPIIVKSVLAKDIQGDSFEPVDITDVFPGDHKTFHAVISIANAPENTAIKAVWLTAANQKMGEFELKTSSSRNIDFTFEPYAGKLPPGNYKVEIYINGNLDRTLHFSVSRQEIVQSPESTNIEVNNHSDYVTDVIITDTTEGPERTPGEAIENFKSSSIFHAVVQTQDAPSNTRFKATWYAVDLGSASTPNALIDSYELTTDGTRNIDFTLTPTTSWPAGTYKVDISVNGDVVATKTFKVQP